MTNNSDKWHQRNSMDIKVNRQKLRTVRFSNLKVLELLI